MTTGLGRRLLGLVVAAACTVVATAAPPALAQMGMMGMGGWGGLTKPAVTPRILRQYQDMLALSPEQKRAAEDLHAGYQADFRAATARLEDVFNAMQEEVQNTGEWQLYQDVMPDVMVKFMRRAERLNESFHDDLKSLLDNQQLQRFDAVERMGRRKAHFKLGLDGAQTLDLHDLVAGLRLDAASAAALAPFLDQYAADIDREIVARNAILKEMMAEWAKQTEAGEDFDESTMMKPMQDMMAAGKRMAEINDRHARQVQATLPAEVQKDFERQVKLAKYPLVYKKSYADRVIDAAERLADLDDSQKEGIAGIKERHQREAESANDRWAAVMADLQAGQSEEAMFGGMWMIAQDPKFIEARDARTAIDNRTADAIKALLSADQRAKLPHPKRRPEFDFDAPSEGD